MSSMTINGTINAHHLANTRQLLVTNSRTNQILCNPVTLPSFANSPSSDFFFLDRRFSLWHATAERALSDRCLIWHYFTLSTLKYRARSRAVYRKSTLHRTYKSSYARVRIRPRTRTTCTVVLPRTYKRTLCTSIQVDIVYAHVHTVPAWACPSRRPSRLWCERRRSGLGHACA